MATTRKEAIQRMSNMNLQNVGGVNYVTYELIQDVTKHLELIRQVEIRDDDILTVGFPRSGNHWAFEVISMILHQDTNFGERTFYGSLLDNMGDKIHENLSTWKSPRILTSHNRMHRIPVQAIEKKVKLIYLVRNPKDALVSFYKLMTGLKIESNVYKGTWEEFFLLQMSGDFPWGSWFDHVLATETFMHEHSDCPVHIHSFDEMKKDPVKAIKKLSEFLSKSDTLAEKIAAATDFSNMSKTLLEGKMKEEKEKHMKDNESQFRKGQVGDWKNWFTVAQNEIFDRHFHNRLGGTNLGKILNQYL